MSYTAKKSLSFGQAIRNAIQDMRDDERRRIRRSEYWWCMLAIVIYYAIFASIRFLLHNVLDINISGWIGILLFTVLSIPPVGLWAMENYGRLHDTNRRDSWLAGIFLPAIVLFVIHMLIVTNTIAPESTTVQTVLFWTQVVLGIVTAVFSLICLRFTIQDSDRGKNDYGPSPKYVKDSDV